MRTKSIALLILCTSAALAQAPELSTSWDGLGTAWSTSWNGLELAFVTRIEPLGTPLPESIKVGPAGIHRSITDNTHKREFGYDVTLDPAADGKTARIRIERSGAKEHNEAGWKLLELPKYPVIPNVRVGDTVALDLLVNPATGEKIVDYITLRRRGELNLQREPRDFQLSDVEMNLDSPQVFVGGSPLSGMNGTRVSGFVVWLYVAGHGRYILSLVPNEKLGFHKNGVVSENVLLFHDGATEFRVECQRRIAPTSGPFNLYLVHEGEWWPGQADAIRIGAANKPELVVGKK